MGFLRRLLSSSYRKALTAEAAGDLPSAARFYILCGERDKAVEMHMTLARGADPAEEQINLLFAALGLTRPEQPIRLDVFRELGRAFHQKATELGPRTGDGQQALREAASYFEQGESWEAAGDSFLDVGERAQAVTAFSRAGLLEKVEEILSLQEDARGRRRREDDQFKDYEAFLKAGQRDEAIRALKACIDAAERKGEYRRLLTDLERRLLRRGRLSLDVGDKKVLIIGRLPCLLGRDESCDLQVRGSSVSRRHARILLTPKGVAVQDEGSHNGTLLNGLRISSSMPLPAAGTLGLGESCEVRFDLFEEAGPLLKLEVDHGLDMGRVTIIGVGAFDLGLLLDIQPLDLVVSFTDDRPGVRATAGELLLNQTRVVGSAQLIEGDTIRQGSHVLEVKG